MACSFKLSRRIARFRAPVFAFLVLALVACDSTESLDPINSSTPDASTPDASTPDAADAIALAEPTVASASFSGGIPIGMAAQPVSEFGQRFSGGKRTIGPSKLLAELSAIRSRGGRVVLMFAGNPRNYRDGSGHFSFDKWKARVNEFRRLNFESYVRDGTIIGHYLIDEPNDPRNWSGRPVPASMVEQMAKYSKDLWPGMATIVRVEPDYLNNDHRYLDAAWAAYLWRRGNVHDYLRSNVAAAQKRGLQLVVGLNVIDGGNPRRTPMSAREVEEWGSAMLEGSYSCAFIMWEHNSTYLRSSGMANAMDALRRKAHNRSSKSCKA
jgi:hypothetical protein